MAESRSVVDDLMDFFQIPGNVWQGKYGTEPAEPGVWSEGDQFRADTAADAYHRAGLKMAGWGVSPSLGAGSLLSRMIPESAPGVIAKYSPEYSVPPVNPFARVEGAFPSFDEIAPRIIGTAGKYSLEEVDHDPFDAHSVMDRALRKTYRPATFGERWDGVPDDPFERAAMRTRLSTPIAERPGYTENMQDLGLNVAAGFAGGPALRAAGAVIRYAPRVAAAIGGVGGAAAASQAGEPDRPTVPGSFPPVDLPPGAAGERDHQGKEWWRTPRVPLPEIPQALAPPEYPRFEPPPFSEPSLTKQELSALGPKGRASAMNQKRESALRLYEKEVAQQRKEHADLVDEMRKDFESKHRERTESIEKLHRSHDDQQLALNIADAEFKRANQSFTEAHPAVTAALPIVGATVAGALPYAGRMVARGFNKSVVNQMENAVERGTKTLAQTGKSAAKTAQREAAAAEIKSVLGPSGAGRMVSEATPVGSLPWWAAMGGGALTSAEANLLPYEIDRLTLPEGSHGRQEADDWRQWAMRGGFGSLSGLLGASIGTSAPLRGKTPLTPAAQLQGILGGLDAVKATETAKALEAKKTAQAAARAATRAAKKDKKLRLVPSESDAARGGG